MASRTLAPVLLMGAIGCTLLAGLFLHLGRPPIRRTHAVSAPRVDGNCGGRPILAEGARADTSAPLAEIAEAESPVVDRAPSAIGVSCLLEGDRLDELDERAGSMSPSEVEEVMDPETTRRIEAVYASLSPRGRELAAWFLSRSRSSGVSAFLALQIGRDPSEEARRALVLALQSRLDEDATRGLLSALDSGASVPTRCAAAYALGPRAGEGSGACLALRVHLESDPSIEVRAAAATGLGLIPSREAANALQAALVSPSSEVRLAAAQGLARQGTFVPVEAVKARQATETDVRVRAALSSATWSEQDPPRGPEVPPRGE